MPRYRLAALVVSMVLFVGFAMEKVFSLTTQRRPDLKDGAVLETSLLLSELDGLLPQKDAIQIYAKLDTPISKIHSVTSSEWLEKIALNYGVPAIYIRSTNNLEDPLLRPNQQIWVQNKKGMIHVVRGEDEPLENIIRTYERMGSTRAKILAANALDEVSYLKDGSIYILEDAKILIPDARRSFPFLARPVAWSRISSGFGVRRHPIHKTRRRHDGYDMVARHGAPVYAGQSGTVVFAGWKGGYGNVIEVRHSQITTLYGHLSEVHVQPGQHVKKKQLIGRVGSTGISTGPHLHFEVRNNSTGRAVRPGRYLN